MLQEVAKGLVGDLKELFEHRQQAECLTAPAVLAVGILATDAATCSTCAEAVSLCICLAGKDVLSQSRQFMRACI